MCIASLLPARFIFSFQIVGFDRDILAISRELYNQINSSLIDLVVLVWWYQVWKAYSTPTWLIHIYVQMLYETISDLP